MKYKIYDITQEVIGSKIYPGDISPSLEQLKNIKEDNYNLSALHMCVHNGTHIDAPLHFFENGKDIKQIDINKFVGLCHVVSFNGIINKQDAIEILENIEKINSFASKKIILKGDAIVSIDAAYIFASSNIELIGTELVSIGDVNAPMDVHKVLLNKEIVLLEGVRLNGIDDGVYFLNCAPLLIDKAEGAPCRAILIEIIDK